MSVPRANDVASLQAAPLLDRVARRVARRHTRRPKQQDGGRREVLAVTGAPAEEEVFEGRPAERPVGVGGIAEPGPEEGGHRREPLRGGPAHEPEVGRDPRHRDRFTGEDAQVEIRGRRVERCDGPDPHPIGHQPEPLVHSHRAEGVLREPDDRELVDLHRARGQREHAPAAGEIHGDTDARLGRRPGRELPRLAAGLRLDGREARPHREPRGRVVDVVGRLAQQDRWRLAGGRRHAQQDPVRELQLPEVADRRGRAEGIGVPVDEARDVLEGQFLELLLDAVEAEVSAVPRDAGQGERRDPPEGGEAGRAADPQRPGGEQAHAREVRGGPHVGGAGREDAEDGVRVREVERVRRRRSFACVQSAA